MATVTKRTRKGKISYQVKVRLKGFPPQSATFDRKTDAERWAQRVEADMRQGQYFPEVFAKKHTINDLITAYLANIEIKNPRRATEVKKLLAWWQAQFGNIALANFKSEHVLKAQTLLRARMTRRKDENGNPLPLSSATINRYTVALGTAFNFGIRKLKWINENPVSAVDKFTEPRGRTRFLSHEEIERLIAACRASKNPHLLAIVLVGISTGARRGEIQRMRWRDVNEDITKITLPKTKNGEIRAIPLHGIAQELITKRRTLPHDAGDFLFPSPHSPKRCIDFGSAWKHALQAAELENFRFHDLRHTCGSYLAMNGANAIEIADILGHKTLAMVRRYAHLSDSHVSKVVETMTERVLGHVKI